MQRILYGCVLVVQLTLSASGVKPAPNPTCVWIILMKRTLKMSGNYAKKKKIIYIMVPSMVEVWWFKYIHCKKDREIRLETCSVMVMTLALINNSP